MIKTITKENQNKEQEIQEQINMCIDNSESFCFDAGAGAGKTYALVKSIEHILQDQDKRRLLKDRSQKILCITYTNAAKDEILDRIGYNSEIKISTIHDFLWDFISIQQILLIHEHREKLKDEQIKAEEQEEQFIENYSLDKNIFEEKVSDKGFLDVFYKNCHGRADPFWKAIRAHDDFWGNCKFDFGKFKDAVKAVNRVVKYSKALEDNPSKVEYRPTQNRDNLAKNIISHDTLLDYCKKIIEEYDILQQMLLDSYPYIFVDEYQDTDKKVIDIISCVKKYAEDKNKSFTVGYFGDALQNIYRDGIGTLPNIDEYELIQKKFNRRSTTHIISVIEKIRNDGFGQQSIYENNEGESCEFYLTNIDFDLSEFLKEHDLTENTACLLLKNNDIAAKRGFSELLDVISKFPRFSEQNYGNINNEFLQKNSLYIGWLLREILEFVKFIECVIDNRSTVNQVIHFMPELTASKITFDRFSKLIKNVRLKLANIETMTIQECIVQLCQIDEGDKAIRNIFSINDENDDVMTYIKNRAFDYLFFSDEENSESLDKFFGVKFKQFENWYNYIFDKNMDTGIKYYTLHGSKGLEFDNVIVILQDNFARRDDYCKQFFENYNNSILNEKGQKRFNEVRNLLYVACSRAKKKLYVIYETEQFKDDKLVEKIGKIFPNVERIEMEQE